MLTQFFANSGLRQFEHDGSTRETWVRKTLESFDQQQLAQVLARLMDRREYDTDADLESALARLDAALVPEGYPANIPPPVDVTALQQSRSAAATQSVQCQPVSPSQPATPQIPASQPSTSLWKRPDFKVSTVSAIVGGVAVIAIVAIATLIWSSATSFTGKVWSAIAPAGRHLSLKEQTRITNDMTEQAGSNAASTRITILSVNDSESRAFAGDLAAALSDAAFQVNSGRIAVSPSAPLWIGVTGEVNGVLNGIAGRLTDDLRADGFRVSRNPSEDVTTPRNRIVILVGRDV